jgi:hypothetical protein
MSPKDLHLNRRVLEVVDIVVAENIGTMSVNIPTKELVELVLIT